MNNHRTEPATPENHDAHWEWDLASDTITLNPSCRQIIGCAHRKRTINARLLKELIHPDDRDAFFEAIRNHSTQPKHQSTIVFRIKPESGAVRWIKCKGDLIRHKQNGNRSKIRGTLTDITGNPPSDTQLFKLNRALLALSKCNQALLHASDQNDLLNDICSTITEVGGYRMCWVGFAGNDHAKTINPMAWSGHEDQYLSTVDIRWDESEKGQGPAGQALRSGHPYTCRNIVTDPHFAPWKDEALKRGYASILAMPLKNESLVFGVLVIYSVTPDAFDIEELTLLTSLADNLAYGITKLRDRIAREEAEEALRQSETRYRSLFHNRHTVMLMIDRGNGMIIDANPAAELFYGWTKTDLCSMSINDITMPARKTFLAETEKSEQEQNHCIVSQRHRLASGSIRTVEVTSAPIIVDGKSLLYAIINDVTDRDHFHEMAIENNLRMHYIMASTNTGLWEMGLTVDTTFWSEEIWDLYGLEPHSCEPSFENWMKTVLPEDRGLMQKAADKAVKNMTEFRGTWRVRKPDGSIRWLMAKGGPFKQSDGTIDRYVGIVFDITDRKLETEAKEQLQTQLRQSQRLETIGTLAGGIAHDFNNILTPILGYSELGLLTVSENDPISEYFREITMAADRAKTLVAQILTFSKEKEHKPVPVRLQNVLDETLKLLRPLIPSTITIEHHIDHSCHTVLGDPSQFHQMILNLCTNAFQSMEGRHGTLRIDLDELTLDEEHLISYPGLDKGSWAHLTISDTGSGMDEFTIEHIFEPFFTTKGPKAGTGLGLSVVHGIVSGCKGQITVHSQPGNGSTFTIYLPVIDRMVNHVFENAPVLKGSNSILCIDDEEGNTRIMNEMLSRIGFRVEITNSGKQAIDLFRQDPERFDLAISDQTMPGMTGTDLADLMHDIRPRMPFILITGNESSIGKTSLESHGISKHLKKPVKLTQLVTAINEVLTTALP
jgi:PAS domain S-box-containing protein